MSQCASFTGSSPDQTLSGQRTQAARAAPCSTPLAALAAPALRHSNSSLIFIIPPVGIIPSPSLTFAEDACSLQTRTARSQSISATILQSVRRIREYVLELRLKLSKAWDPRPSSLPSHTMATCWAALLLLGLPHAHAAGPVGLALDTNTCTNAECYKLCGNQPVRRVHDNSSLSHFSATTRPSWLGRAVRKRHRHAIEQASRRWRGGRRDDPHRL